MATPEEHRKRHPYRMLLEDAFRAAVEAVRPEVVLREHLPEAPSHGEIIVLALGKAADAMAYLTEEHYRACGVQVRGVVVAPRSAHPPQRNDSQLLRLVADHPVPSEASEAAGEALLEAAASATAQDLVLVLLSGGGSALAVAPDGLSLAQLASLHQALLRSGASIEDMNLVRRHVDRIKGGGLAAVAHEAERVIALALSDVVGDDPRVIASGPTVGEERGPEEALRVLVRHGIDLPAVRGALEAEARGDRQAPPKPNDPRLTRVQTKVIATNRQALEAAKSVFERRGIPARITADDVTGDARQAGREAATSITAQPPGPPATFISGGETTLKVTGSGQGGRNSAFALAFALTLPRGFPAYALVADSDGIDGKGGHAGVFVEPGIFEVVPPDEARRLDSDDDSYAVFDRADALFITGATGTNVNDLRFVIVDAQGGRS